MSAWPRMRLGVAVLTALLLSACTADEILDSLHAAAKIVYDSFQQAGEPPRH